MGSHKSKHDLTHKNYPPRSYGKSQGYCGSSNLVSGYYCNDYRTKANVGQLNSPCYFPPPFFTPEPVNHGTSCSDFTYPVHDSSAFMLPPQTPVIQISNDSGYRRHSVPVNQGQTMLTPLKLNQRRRMPSPNPSTLPNRYTQIPGEIIYNQQLQASSDVDLCRHPAQFNRPRFQSPSRLEPHLNPLHSRNLFPPATAPTTRLPSPSDAGRQGVYLGEWSAYNPLNPSGIYSAFSCISNTSPLPVDDVFEGEQLHNFGKHSPLQGFSSFTYSQTNDVSLSSLSLVFLQCLFDCSILSTLI